MEVLGVSEKYIDIKLPYILNLFDKISSTCIAGDVIHICNMDFPFVVKTTRPSNGTVELYITRHIVSGGKEHCLNVSDIKGTIYIVRQYFTLKWDEMELHPYLYFEV